MTDVPVSPESLRPATRPERKFELRRAVMLIILVLGILLLCQPIIAGVFNPSKGTDRLLDSARAQAVTPTVVSQFQIDSRAQPLGQSLSQIRGDISIACRAIYDFDLNGIRVPANAQVIATGYTAALGGLVEVTTGTVHDWVSGNSLRCFDDVRRLEKPYSLPTATMTPTSRRQSVVQAAPISTPLAPVVVTVIAAAPTFKGVWVDDSGCWHVTIEGVKQIFVDGKGVSIGVYCNSSEIKVIK